MSDENENKEAPVEVTLPEETVVEVDFESKEPSISEASAKIVEKKEEEPTPEPPRKKVVDEREKALEELKRQYEFQKQIAESERQARKQAEKFAREQAQQVNYARNEVQDSNLRVIMNAIDATEQQAASAERDYATAMAAGDYAMAAKAQRIMAQAESHLLQLNNGKNRLEEMLQAPQEGAITEPEIPSFEPQIPRDPVEMYASRLAPKSAQWLREHPDAVNKIGKLTRAHQDAVEDGIPAESAEYFRYIEARLGYGSQSDAGGDYESEVEEEPAPRAPPKKPPASAPVTSSASAATPRSSSPNTMVLDSDMVQFAVMAFPDLPRDKAIEAYARNRAALIREGKIQS